MLFILFLVVLGPSCVWAFSWGAWESLVGVHGRLLLGCTGSTARGLGRCGTWWLLYLQHSGLVVPQHVGSQFPDQRLNLRPLHWKVDSQPLDHQGRLPSASYCSS